MPQARSWEHAAAIVIIGAGISGLTAGVALARRGLLRQLDLVVGRPV